MALLTEAIASEWTRVKGPEKMSAKSLAKLLDSHGWKITKTTTHVTLYFTGSVVTSIRTERNKRREARDCLTLFCLQNLPDKC